MPHNFPPQIKDYLKSKLPPTHLMWWVRCQLMQVDQMVVRPISGTGGQLAPVTYYRLTLRDVDAVPGDQLAHVVDISPSAKNDFRINDRFSLFGHELVTEEKTSIARYLFDHENEQSGPCHAPKYVDKNLVPVPALKVSTPGSGRDKGAKMVTGFLAKFGGNPELLESTLPGGIDLKEYYDNGSLAVHHYVKENPDDKFPCLNPREGGAGGGSIIGKW